ncbi:hypothetical protein LSAT2_017866 [Lamellibrachia satsuma]|nr:hypothetical protein LSAT2_017866 [Lamellibrachia satsuma]
MMLLLFCPCCCSGRYVCCRRDTDVVLSQTVFWEDTYPFVHAYTDHGRRGIAIGDTLLGTAQAVLLCGTLLCSDGGWYMADGLHWCGQIEEPGVNYEHCPAECSDDAVNAFWGAVSVQFASEASGPVRVILNATKSPVFRQNSPFAKYELPNIIAPRIPHLHVLLVHEPERESRERCGGTSLLTLESIVTSSGVKYSCTDNPSDILHLLCVDSASARECQVSASGTVSSIALNTAKAMYMILFTVTIYRI